MAQSIKLGSDTYLDASGVVMSDHSTLDAAYSNRIKLADGTLIQYGRDDIEANAQSKQVNFPQAFAAGTFVVCTPTYSYTPNVILSVAAVGLSSFTVYRATTATYSQPVQWVAIGRWK